MGVIRETTRNGLIACLALLLAAGPSLCCCSLQRTIAAPFATAETAPSCPHCNPTASIKPKSKPQCPECPCRQSPTGCKLIPQATIKPGAWADKWLVQTASVEMFALAPLLPAINIKSKTPGVASHRPFLEVDDLLDVQHKLRC